MPDDHFPDDASTDDAFFARFVGGDIEPSRFDHRAHLRAAACALMRMPFLEACIAMRDGLRRLAARAGRPGLYHETQTIAAMALVDECLDDDASRAGRRTDAPEGRTTAAGSGPSTTRADIDRLVERHPRLLDKHAIRGLYREDTWASDGARRGLRLPDAATASDLR